MVYSIDDAIDQMLSDFGDDTDFAGSPAQLRRNQQAGRAAQDRYLPPLRVRLVYQVPVETPRERAIVFQRLMLSVLSPYGIAGTVIMPGSRAACAFDA